MSVPLRPRDRKSITRGDALFVLVLAVFIWTWENINVKALDASLVLFLVLGVLHRQRRSHL
jgi:hypothetical protein